MYVIGTAGHVDHGKSVLVRALTGIDPDRLQEEKDRGMTIDLGFAWLKLPGGQEVSIVDVPGHERFIKNMLAGVGGIDLALLVIAADEGVMPQTREHLAILDLLQLKSGILVVTKKDLVDGDWLEIVSEDVRDAVKATALEGSPLVACSAVTGEGLDDLVSLIEQQLGETPPKRDIGRPRLPIDRAFTIAGFGTVVTGTLLDGSFSVGQEVEIAPGRRRARIRGLQTHRQKVEKALPGTRTAINLSGVSADELLRGQVVALPDTLLSTTAARRATARRQRLAPADPSQRASLLSQRRQRGVGQGPLPRPRRAGSRARRAGRRSASTSRLRSSTATCSSCATPTTRSAAAKSSRRAAGDTAATTAERSMRSLRFRQDRRRSGC